MSAHPNRLGRYEILGSLAQGGMAELFLARLAGVRGFARRVVIKRVLPGLVRNHEFVEMFLQEARIAATLHHQNIVQVYDIGHDEGGYFFAMEHLHGDHVGHIIRAAGERGRELPLEIALEIARGACAGLHYAHERIGSNGAPLGLVHRDVSPQNLFVTFDGGVKLLDFGIAKAVHQLSDHYTRSGTLRGKLPYMSPEQSQGQPVDRRSDLFSLSVVLWEMTVGKRLFGGESQSDFDVLKAIVECDAPAPSSHKPDYPPDLERIVMKGLRRQPSERYQTADEMLLDLESFLRKHGLWVSARDLAGFVRDLFGERAAAWRQAEKEETAVTVKQGGNIIPFPHTTEVAWSPNQESTLDVSRPGLPSAVAPGGSLPAQESSAAPTAPDAPSPRRLRNALLLAGCAALLVAGSAAIGFAVARQSAAGGRDRAAGAPAATTASDSPVALLPTAPRSSESEDLHWFQPGDYLISDKPYTDGKLDRLVLAKRLTAPNHRGEAAFLTGLSNQVTTANYWSTRIARPEDLVVGGLAFCRADYNEVQASAPADKTSARQGYWMLSRVTDTADLAQGKVLVGPVSCNVDGVRVPVPDSVGVPPP